MIGIDLEALCCGRNGDSLHGHYHDGMFKVVSVTAVTGSGSSYFRYLRKRRNLQGLYCDGPWLAAG
jgi:hypothetical protein